MDVGFDDITSLCHGLFAHWNLAVILLMRLGRSALLAPCVMGAAVGLYGAAMVCRNPSFAMKHQIQRRVPSRLSCCCVFRVKKKKKKTELEKRISFLYLFCEPNVWASQISRCPPAWLPHLAVEWQFVRCDDCGVKVCSSRTHIMKWAHLLGAFITQHAHHVPELKCLAKTTPWGDRPGKWISAPRLRSAEPQH